MDKMDVDSQADILVNSELVPTVVHDQVKPFFHFNG
jgi:hypothetical protein